MILAYIEQDRGKVSEASFEALTLARQLAEPTNAPLHAIAIGSAPDELVARLGAFGVHTLHLAQENALAEYAPGAYAQCIVEIINAQKPNAVLAAGSERGNEIMAHVAAKTNLPMAANCISAQAGDAYAVTRLRWGGSLLEEAKLGGATKLLTVAPNSIPAQAASNAQTVVTNSFVPNLSENDLRVRVASRIETSSGKISLGEARVVVGGGRGVGSAEGFKVLEELADLLGGAVGGSRVVTGLGWRPHADQIGQTGNRIQPELYISCGVSGAIQHMVGAKGAKHILAINTDPEASIMYKADYAVIGDLHQVVPAICEEIKKRRGLKNTAT
jgi:electron transfer flavoprotein alpha subunit